MAPPVASATETAAVGGEAEAGSWAKAANVPPDAAAAANVGGPPVTVTMPVPGQNGAVTFAGAGGQTVTITIGPTIPQAQVSVLRPDGTTLVSPQTVFSFGKTITATLPVSGSYTIVLDPTQTYSGSITPAVT